MPTLPRVVLRRCLDLGRSDGVGDAALGDDALRKLLKKRSDDAAKGPWP